jgi:tRNA 5-methylaminomethyl-2-thiouridine biosynthesis bifunctional protein
VPGLHRLRFAGGRVTLTLAVGDAGHLAARLPVAADAFFLDGFAPARNPAMWSAGLMKSLARLARPQATLSTYTAARAVREALEQAGFQPRLVPGFGGKRERIEAVYAPRWRTHPAPPDPPAWPWREAIVVGAGLAGTAVASVLAQRGWRAALLLERRAFPAATPIGKLQVADSDAEFERQLACVRSLAFPEAFLQALDAYAAADAAGVRTARGGLWLPQCGATDPAERCRALLHAPQGDGAIVFRPGTEVSRLERHDGLWHALAGDGRVRAAAPVVVLANAGDAMRLAGQAATALRRVRGQTTLLAPDALPGLRAVLGGDAYACPMPGGGVLVGSTFDDGDTLAPDPEADRSNLRRLARLLPPGGTDPEALAAHALPGACGFRFATRDRLPMIGALPDEAAARARAGELARNDRLPLPLLPGVYGAFAFGARGLLWSSLAAEILAAAIDGAAAPVETDLLAAVAPSRFLKQQLRRRRLR